MYERVLCTLQADGRTVLLVRQHESQARARGRRSLQEMERLGLHNGLCTALCVQFATDIEDVLLDRVHTQDQVRGNLPVGGAIKEQSQDFMFTARERFHESTWMGSLERS